MTKGDVSKRDILFVDQSGALGGAEFALLDVVEPYADRCRVMLFEDGETRTLLERKGIPVTVLPSRLGRVRRESGVLRAFVQVPSIIGLTARVARHARGCTLLYANTQKALLVCALVRLVSGTPLVFHLHDILSAEHFSAFNRRLSVTAANRACKQVIADSEATRQAFVDAGGRTDLVQVIYYGFKPVERGFDRAETREELGLDPEAFVVGHFGRLSPWKGQDVLLRALARCPEMMGLFVGEALFGEDEIGQELRRLAAELGIADRVLFTGFRSDVTRLMQACDLVVHSSTSPEPFGRVIVEAMLATTPVVAARAGGPLEIIDDGVTGWLTAPGDVSDLSDRLQACRSEPVELDAIRLAARREATRRFGLPAMHKAIAGVIDS